MGINKINLECECGCTECDVQCKIVESIIIKGKTKSITKIQTKCLKCKKNHFLDETDKRCKPYFPKK